MKSLKSTLLVSDSPMPWGRRVRKLCRAAVVAGSPDGGILQGGEAWCLQGPGSGPCSPAVRPGVPACRSGTGFLGDIPLSPGEEAEEGSWVGCPAQAACWGAGARSGPAGQGGTEEAAWSDGQSHRDLRDEDEADEGGKIRKKQVGEESQIEKQRKNTKRNRCKTEGLLSNH